MATRPTIYLGKKKKKKLTLGKPITYKKKVTTLPPIVAKPKEKKPKKKEKITTKELPAETKQFELSLEKRRREREEEEKVTLEDGSVVPISYFPPSEQKKILAAKRAGKAAEILKIIEGFRKGVTEEVIKEDIAREVRGEEILPGVIKGTVPITPVAGAAGIAKTLYKGKDITKIVANERTLQTIMRQFKISRGAAATIANKVSTSTPQAILKVLTSKPVKVTALSLAGYAGIAAWLASDNVLTGTTFTMRKLRDTVVDETTREEALEVAEEVQEWIDTASAFVNVATRINPLLWPFRTIFMVNRRKAQVDFDLEVALIKTKLTAAGEAEEFWRESAAAKERVAGEEPTPEEPVIEEPAAEGRPPIEL